MKLGHFKSNPWRSEEVGDIATQSNSYLMQFGNIDDEQ
jgi:hypothetical protein